MASYPTAVVSFPSRSNGQTIDASHINNLQDEVTAIESGLLTGTAPLTCSNASVNTLQVSGASTFAGNMTVTGKLQSSNSTCNNLSVAAGSTFAGDVLFNSTNVTAPNQPRFHGYHSASVTISSASTSVLSLDTEVYDVGNFHSTSVNPSRVTVTAGSSGLYHIVGLTHVVPSVTGEGIRL